MVQNQNLFDQYIKRNNTGSIKWDMTQEFFGTKDVLPMWIADMDFPSPQAITDTLIERTKHPIYGYTAPTSYTYNSLINWMKNKYEWDIDRDSIFFSAGVVSALGTCIQALTKPGDRIMIQSPVYTPFFDMIQKNDRELVNSPLAISEGQFRISFEDIESKMRNGLKMFILCSPHNPGGRIWTKDELCQLAELCLKYGVNLLSDEIHADLALPGQKHYPVASLDERYTDMTITCMAPSKTFNIAGLQSSVLIVQNHELKKKIKETQYAQGFHGLNIFAIDALTAAYNHGDQWLTELLDYIEKNVRTSLQFFKQNLPAIKPMVPQASFLLWLDCRELGISDKELQKVLVEKGKIALEPGNKYGPGGEGWMRMNIGCPHDVLMDGLNRIKKALS
ncbi:MalY/PatB family protein [Peribacillus alkalitolerans]|uniref:MalY/PatB family protein n=1 Tax=Peribacillus alkalitolerans TaxID=1550385 RepID=UPI0013D4A703|nr:PatB family C-S lyase [Peribacillus alkalitolerans]